MIQLTAEEAQFILNALEFETHFEQGRAWEMLTRKVNAEEKPKAGRAPSISRCYYCGGNDFHYKTCSTQRQFDE